MVIMVSDYSHIFLYYFCIICTFVMRLVWKRSGMNVFILRVELFFWTFLIVNQLLLLSSWCLCSLLATNSYEYIGCLNYHSYSKLHYIVTSLVYFSNTVPYLDFTCNYLHIHWNGIYWHVASLWTIVSCLLFMDALYALTSVPLLFCSFPDKTGLV